MCWYEVVKFLELDFFEFTVQFLQGHTKAAMSLGEVRFDPNRIIKTGNCFVESFKLTEHTTKIVIYLSVIWLDVWRRLVAGNGFLQAPLFLKRIAQIAMEYFPDRSHLNFLIFRGRRRQSNLVIILE